MSSDLQIGMRQGLSDIYSLFGAESETFFEKVNRLGLHVKSGSRHSRTNQAPGPLRTFGFASGKSWLKGFFLRNGRARRYSLDLCEVIA